MSKEFEVLDQFVELTDEELKEVVGGQYLPHTYFFNC